MLIPSEYGGGLLKTTPGMPTGLKRDVQQKNVLPPLKPSSAVDVYNDLAAPSYQQKEMALSETMVTKGYD